MRRIRSLTGPVVLAALFAPSTPQPVLAQDDPEVFPEIEIRSRDYRSMEIRVSELGEFLRDNYVIVTGEGRSEPMAVWLRVEVTSRERGLIGSTDSRRIEVAPGETYRAGAFIPLPDHWIPQIDAWIPLIDDWVPSPESRLVLQKGRASKDAQGRFPGGCEDATVAITVWVEFDGRAVVDSPLHEGPDCLNIEQ